MQLHHANREDLSVLYACVCLKGQRGGGGAHLEKHKYLHTIKHAMLVWLYSVIKQPLHNTLVKNIPVQTFMEERKK